MKQRIGFLYLKTGAGHISGAKILVDRLNGLYPDKAECFLMDGFGNNSAFFTLFFEKGYFATTNYFEPLYVAFYQFTKSRASIDFIRNIMKPFLVPKVKNFLEKNNITKVVCLHEILIPAARLAIDRVNPAIPLISLVMDPFTAHPSWFYEKNTELIVFSKKLRNEAIKKYNFDEKRVHIFPILLSKRFSIPIPFESTKCFRAQFGIMQNKKTVLIVGGGEGLKQAAAIVRCFIKAKTEAHLIVVCGKNRGLKLTIEYLARLFSFKNITVLGFVTYMPELMNLADCIITKGGPATVMESLSIGKPLVISTYVRGQEFGNMLYVVQNNAGKYIPSAKNIVTYVESIIFDDEKMKKIAADIKKIGIKSGLDNISRFIYKF